MIAEFYLLNISFTVPNDLTIQQIEEKLRNLEIDISYIRDNQKIETLFKDEAIYDEVIVNNFTVADILYYGKGKNIFDRDTIEALRKIIDVVETQSITSQEVMEVLLPENNNLSEKKEVIYGLLCLHKIQNIDINPLYLVYDKNNWFQFHRYFLGFYPQNTDFFLNECNKYFPNLYFHEENRNTITKILNDFSQKIVYHLGKLNDEFKTHRQANKFFPDALNAFSIACALDETASLEGNAEKKKRLNFQFLDKVICCEPHLKLCKNDKNQQEYFFNRIYFHEGFENFLGGKILIGHIGEHL
jgi:hypothetical protein